MKNTLTSGSISNHMLRLTIPTVVGFIAIVAFNFTDTYFVARLGTDALAAMGFTFPVVAVVGAIAMGISTGAGSILARAMGAGRNDEVRTAATHGIFLALVLTALIGGIGLSTMNPLFRAMGARGESLNLVKQYMGIWYASCVVVVTPPVGDSNLRSTGDMLRPAIVMLICAGMNVILDPLLIFGIGPFPAMGITGAAIATVIARFFGMMATLTFNFRAGLLRLSADSFRRVWQTWSRILSIGIPTALTQLLPSVLRATLTAMAAASVGTAGVAAVAAGSRIESVPLLVAFAFNFSILAIMAQNYGAGNHDRVNHVRRALMGISLGYGGLLAVIMWFAAPALSGIFSADESVIHFSITYVRIIFLASPGILLIIWTSVALNAVGKPFRSLILNGISTLGLTIPGAFLGTFLLSGHPFTGMMIGLCVAYLLSGALAWIVGRHTFDRLT